MKQLPTRAARRRAQALARLGLSLGLVLRQGHRASTVFCMDTQDKRGPAQFRASWAAQQFGGRCKAPMELSSAETTQLFLQRHAEAVGYLPLARVDPSLRIVYMP